MSLKLYDEDNIIDIANAIREKAETTNTYKITQMAAAIRNIQTKVPVQPNLTSLIANAPGSYTPPSGYDGFSIVRVSIPIEGFIDLDTEISGTGYSVISEYEFIEPNNLNSSVSGAIV